MGKLNYDGYEWIGTSQNEQGVLCVRMSNTAFQRHVKLLLQRQNLPTQSHLELLEWMRRVDEQRYQIIQQLRNLEYWLDCTDPDVRIIRVPARKGEKR